MYSAFTDKVQRNCHSPAPGRNCYNIGKLILLSIDGPDDGDSKHL
jgi:hypothetical protein